jgi:hypothetical protein
MEKRRLIGFAATLVITFMFCGCPMEPEDDGSFLDLPETEGEFTLTGAEKYNGKFAMLKSPSGLSFLYGFKDMTNEGKYVGLPIENGTVTIPVYKLSALTIATGGELTSDSFGGYDSTESGKVVLVYVFDQEEYKDSQPADPAVTVTFSSVSFTSGKADRPLPGGY